MSHVKMVDDKSAKPKAKKVFADIRKTRKTDYVNNIWRALGSHPPMLERFWSLMKDIMIKDSRLDALTKEYIYLAVSMTNNCEYCINSHIAAARRKGMDDETLAELVEIVALANYGNRLSVGLQVEVDEVFRPARK
jgi:AhpD family alkylhydroperoxidase